MAMFSQQQSALERFADYVKAREKESAKKQLAAQANISQAQHWGSLAWHANAFPMVEAPVSIPAPFDSAILDKLKTSEPRKVLRPAPDYVTPLMGYRAWRVDNMKLIPIGCSGIWEPKKVMEAQCNRPPSPGWIGPQDVAHDAPSKHCACGIWAFHSLDKLTAALGDYQNVVVMGQVSLWGRVIECENGYRAQFAYPKELWLFDNSLEQLGYIYGVPVRTV